MKNKMLMLIALSFFSTNFANEESGVMEAIRLLDDMCVLPIVGPRSTTLMCGSWKLRRLPLMFLREDCGHQFSGTLHTGEEIEGLPAEMLFGLYLSKARYQGVEDCGCYIKAPLILSSMRDGCEANI